MTGRPGLTSSTTRLDPLVRDAVLGHGQHDQVGDEHPVGVEVAGDELGPLARGDDEDTARQSRSGEGRRRSPRRRRDPGRSEAAISAPAATFEYAVAPASPPPAPPAADRPDAAEGSILEVVRSCVPPGARELEQLLDGRRLRRPAPARAGRLFPSRPRPRRAPRRARGRAGRSRPSCRPASPSRSRRSRAAGTARARVDRGENRRRRTQCLRASTVLASRKRSRGPRTGSSEMSTTAPTPCSASASSRPRDERDAVVVVSPQLLRPADENGRRELVRELGESVADDRRVVLAVDERDGARHRVVTSRSMRRVYFWKWSVSSENSMMRSRPWKG